MFEKIYKFINKNTKNKFIFFIVLTFLSSIPVIFIPGLKQGHDLYFHLGRISSLSKNIKDLNLFNGIYPFYLNNYGYGNGLFYPDLFLYIPATLNAIGINLITSYKLFIILINFFSILSIYKCVNTISKSNYASILGTIIYSFASYRLVDLYERAALGESLAFIFAPLSILGIYEIIFKDKKKFYYLIIGMSGLILSHIISTYIIGILLIILCLLNIKSLLKNKRYLYLIISALITLLITSYFLIPMIEQMLSQKFYFNNTSNIEEFKLYNRTVPIYLLFLEVPNLRDVLFNKYWTPAGIGIIFLYFIYRKFKDKNKDIFINQCFYISIITLFFIGIPLFWKISIVNKLFYIVQFPWRFYLIPTLLLTISGSMLFSKNESLKLIKYSSIISLISLISIFIICIVPNRLYKIDGYDTAFSEYLPVEVNKEYIENRNDIISNNEIKYSLKRYKSILEIGFENNNSNNTYLELPLIYYKGYTAKINNSNLEVCKTSNGLVRININDINNGTIKVKYEGTKIFKITKYISLISSILFIIYVVKEVKYEE